MSSFPTLRRWLSAGVTALVFAVVVALGAISGQGVDPKEEPKEAKPSATHPWPLWGGHLSRNMVNTVDRNVPAEWDIDPKKGKRIKWAADLGSKAYGGPIIADGKVFIGTNNERPRDPKVKGDKGVVMCFEEATGKFLWQRTYDKLPIGREVDWPLEGICSSPVVEGNRLYYVTNRCQLVCVNTADGKDVWVLDMIGQLGVFPHNLATCSPLLLGDLVFVVTGNGVDRGHINIPAPAAPSFVAVNKKDGTVAWQNNAPSANLLNMPKDADKNAYIKSLVNQGKLLMHGQWSNPTYANANGQPQIIFPGGDGWLRAFEPATGKLVWEFDCNPKNAFYVLGSKATRNDFVATPVVHDNKVYIGVGQDPEHEEGIGHLWCIDVTRKGDVSPGFVKKDKELITVFDPKAPENKDSALVWHYGGVGDAKTRIPGRREKYVFGRTLSTACVHDGLLYIAELGGYLHCLDAKTGERLWFHNLKTPVWSSPYYCDGKIYLGADDSVVYVFEAGRKKNLIAENDMGSAVRATPVVANGVLYVQTENKLYAIQ